MRASLFGNTRENCRLFICKQQQTVSWKIFCQKSCHARNIFEDPKYNFEAHKNPTFVNLCRQIRKQWNNVAICFTEVKDVYFLRLCSYADPLKNRCVYPVKIPQEE